MTRKKVYLYGMEYPGAALQGRLFLSCIREQHHSREVVLQQHALLHVFHGILQVSYAQHTKIFHAGDTILIPRNQLGRMTKLPEAGQPFRSVSILFQEDMLRKHYLTHPQPLPAKAWDHCLPLARHPLLDSLFNSLLPYFELHDELPQDIADVKMLETLTILQAVDPQAGQLLSALEEPGKVSLTDFMEQHFMYNLPLEKFSYLTGRSLTTFKKDFQKIYGTTPGRWLTQKRLALAHYQLSVQKKKPTEVYWETGFENLSHFSFTFKKHFGYSPASLHTDKVTP